MLQLGAVGATPLLGGCTSDQAFEAPSRVVVRNAADRSHTFTVDVRVDGKNKFSEVVHVASNSWETFSGSFPGPGVLLATKYEVTAVLETGLRATDATKVRGIDGFDEFSIVMNPDSSRGPLIIDFRDDA